MTGKQKKGNDNYKDKMVGEHHSDYFYNVHWCTVLNMLVGCTPSTAEACTSHDATIKGN
jgi:hypothetical protein